MAWRATNKRVTIKDVASLAGVSVTTVSNALNGRTYAMSASTLHRIQEAIRILNYRPNSIARGLVTRYTSTIGLILAEIETPLFLQALNIIEPIARSSGFNILLCNARNQEDEIEALNLLLEKQAAGIIFLSTSNYKDDTPLLELKELGLPVVLINRPTQSDCFDRINWDNEGGVAAAVDHLVRLGHRCIAHMRGPAERQSSEERVQGYLKALAKWGLSYREDYMPLADYTAPQDTWERTTLELLAVTPRPTAIIASDDIVAAVAIRTIKSIGLRVPHDVAVVGIDDQPFSSYFDPALTTVKLPIIEAGRQGIEMLLARISGDCQQPRHIVLPCSLVIRESCGAKLLGQIS